MDFKEILRTAAVAAVVVWMSNNIPSVRRLIGR